MKGTLKYERCFLQFRGPDYFGARKFPGLDTEETNLVQGVGGRGRGSDKH